MAVEQPLGLTMEIMRQRSFARTWQDLKRPRGEDEDLPNGPMVDWCERIQLMRDKADLERAMGRDDVLRKSLARVGRAD